MCNNSLDGTANFASPAILNGQVLAGSFSFFEIDIMRRQHSRCFRPAFEQAEDRCLATVHPLVAQLGSHGLSTPVHHHALTHPLQHGRIVVMASGGSGQGQLPSSFQNWGVVTIWNTTNHRVTFSVSASTFQLGRFFNFTLRPGSFQAYYAAYDRFNNPPAFRVSFDPIHQSNSIQLSDVNTVFERKRWVPTIGNEGRPFAIATDVSGLFLTTI
jgi:hypothetical protein